MSAENFSADTRVDLIPKEWGVGRLGDFADISTGKKDVNQGNPDGKYPFFTCSRQMTWSDEYSFDCEAIMIAGNGIVGNTHYYNGKFEAYQRTYVLSEFSDGIDVRFLYSFLGGNLKQDLLRAKTGSTMPYIRKGDLTNYEFPLPPLPEQRRIAAVLNAIQDAIAAQEDVIAAARELKRSLMQRLFTYGPYREPAETKETEIGEIPVHWEVRLLGDIAKIGNGATPKRTNERYWSGGSVPWLTSTRIHDQVIEYADEYVTEIARSECHLPLVPRHSILVAITGQGKTLGNAALTAIDTTINQHLAYITVQNESLVPKFIMRYLQNRYEDLRHVGRAGGSTKAALTCGLLKLYAAPIPPCQEQSLITRFLDENDVKIAAEEDRLTAIQALFKSMLHQLMTGQIRLLSDEGLCGTNEKSYA